MLYLIAMRAAFDYERRKPAQEPSPETAPGMSLKETLIRYAVSALAVIVAGIWLPYAGLQIAETMGWQTTFVGTLVIAASTSVPELVVTISALRMGAADLAIGSLLGSNLFDILILAIDDLFYQKGPLLSSVSNAHAITAFAAVIMSGIFIVALLFRPQSRIRGTISWISLSLLLVYLFSAYASFLLGH